jgi:hypothetical protein
MSYAKYSGDLRSLTVCLAIESRERTGAGEMRGRGRWRLYTLREALVSGVNC